MIGEQLLRRLLWLVPPKGVHLSDWHGVFASHATLRAAVMRKAANDNEEHRPITVGAKKKEKPKRPRVDWGE